MAKIQLHNIKKTYPLPNNPRPLLVLDSLNASISDGEIVTLLGPNGCGKTTLLKLIAGIEDIDRGSITLNECDPKHADCGFIVQNYDDSLLPWLSALDNILFPFTLRNRRKQRLAAESHLNELLRTLSLTLPLEHYPYQLSGGQKQVVSLLRTLLCNPDVLLMDEPFSALDHPTRLYMHKLLLSLWQQWTLTIVFVSHDIEEAMLLGERLFLMGSLPSQITHVYELPFTPIQRSERLESSTFASLKNELIDLLSTTHL